MTTEKRNWLFSLTSPLLAFALLVAGASLTAGCEDMGDGGFEDVGEDLDDGIDDAGDDIEDAVDDIDDELDDDFD